MALNKAIGTFNVPTSGGTVSVSGLGFRPDLVLLLGGYMQGSAQNGIRSGDAVHHFGAFTDTYQMCVGISSADGVDLVRESRSHYDNRCLHFCDADDHTSTHLSCEFSSMDTGGFTLQINTNPSTAEPIYYLAIGGLAGVEIGHWDSINTTGSQQINYSDSSLDPELIFFVSTKMRDFQMPGSQNGGHLSLSAATSSSTEFVDVLSMSDGVGKTYANSVSYDGKMWSHSNYGETETEPVAALTAMAQGSFTINYSAVDASYDYACMYIAIEGVTAEIADHDEPVSDGTLDATFSFTPEFVIAISAGKVDSETITVDARHSIGWSDGTNHRCLSYAEDDDNGVSSVRKSMRSDACVALHDSAGTNLGYADATMGSNKATMDWSSTDGTRREVKLIAIKESGTTTPSHVETVDVTGATGMAASETYYNPGAPATAPTGGPDMDESAPTVAGILEDDIDAIRDNAAWLMSAAAGQGYILPGWNTTVDGGDKQKPDSITMVSGSLRMRWRFTWSGAGNLIGQVWEYDRGFGDDWVTLNDGTAVLSYDASNNFTGATTS